MQKTLSLLVLLTLILAACTSQSTPFPSTERAAPPATQTPTKQLPSNPTPEPSATFTEAPTAAACFASFYPVGFSTDGATLYGLESVDGQAGTSLQALSASDFTTQNVIHNEASVAVAVLSPNRETLAWALPDFSVQLVELSSGAVTGTLTGHQGMVNALVFSPDGERLYSASSDTTVMVWDASTHTQISSFTPTFAADNFPGEILGLGISPDGKTLLTIPMVGSARAWDTTTFAQTGDYPGVIDGSYNGARALYSPDGEYLAIGLAAGPGDTSVWKLADTSLVWTGGAMASFDFSADAQLFATFQLDAENTPQIVISSADGQTVFQTIEPSPDAYAMRLQFSPDGRTLVSTTGSQVNFWNVGDGTLIGSYTPGCP